MPSPDRNRHRQRRKSLPRSASLDSTGEPSCYTRILQARLREAKRIVDGDEPAVSMQTRHIHNRQHAIPFRQQYFEQLTHDFKTLERQLVAERRKEKEEYEKKYNHDRQLLLEEHAKKQREFELYNNRSLVREAFDAYLKNSTPQAQLKRIFQLEDNYTKFKQQYDDLVQKINQNATKYDEDKRNHTNEISQITNRFEKYLNEFNNYKDVTKNINNDFEMKFKVLEEKQELLNREQEEQGSSIKDLSLQCDKLGKLLQELEQIIHENQLEKLTKRIDEIQTLINEIQEGMKHSFDRMLTLEEENQQIRHLFIQSNNLTALQSRIIQAENQLIHHNNLLEQFNQTINNLREMNDLTRVKQDLQLIHDDLQQKSVQIDYANSTAIDAVNQIDGLRQFLTNISGQLSDFEEKFSNLKNIPLALNHVQSIPNESSNHQQFNNVDDYERAQQQLNDLAREIDNLKRMMNTSNDSSIAQNETDRNLDIFLDRAKQEIMKLVFNALKQYKQQIDQAQTMIEQLKAQIDALVTSQSRYQPSSIQQVRPSRHIPYLESLEPKDLLTNDWL